MCQRKKRAFHCLLSRHFLMKNFTGKIAREERIPLEKCHPPSMFSSQISIHSDFHHRHRQSMHPIEHPERANHLSALWSPVGTANGQRGVWDHRATDVQFRLLPVRFLLVELPKRHLDACNWFVPFMCSRSSILEILHIKLALKSLRVLFLPFMSHF